MPRSWDTLTVERPPEDAAPAPEKVQVDEDASRDAQARYTDGALIAEGGMGKVLLVHDRYVGRHVALKQLKDDERTDALARARFEREARLQGQLEHPAIVPVYDLGSGSDGSPFFTMKHVKGQSLAEVLADVEAGRPTRFSRRKLLSAFSQLCVAVHYAHERGVVHRDIKPSNIMLGAYAEVYLIDWGVAKVARDDGSDGGTGHVVVGSPGALDTGSGTVLGTISTMAPEQALGGDVDARADVYSLGAVLFQILTGKRLHPDGEFDDVVAQIVLGVDARPSARAPEADVAPELEALCVAATRVRPEERLASAAALHDAIEAYLDGDRDQELRRAAAKKHSEAARAVADTILSKDGGHEETPGSNEAARVKALGEVGKALALDPADKDALSTLVELLTSPPKVAPSEVQAEERAAARRRIRTGGIACALVYGYISINALTTWQLGVRDVTSFALAHVLWGCAFVGGIVTIWRPSYVPLFVTFLFGVATCVFVTRVYSPYLMVPPLLTMHAVLFALVQHWRMRVVMIVAASIGWTVSVFGEHWGLLTSTVRYTNGDMLIHSPVIALPATGMTLYLYVSVLAMIVAPALVIGALRGAWLRSERAMRLQVWQLRQLVANEATPTVAPPPDAE